MVKNFVKDINKIIDSYFPYYKITPIPIDHYLFHFLLITGVYIFYSKKEIIYIGASINIGSRLNAHFSKGSLYRNRIKEIEIIRLREVDNPCGVEAQLINKFSPLFNKDYPSPCFYPFPSDLNLLEIEKQIKQKLGIK